MKLWQAALGAAAAGAAVYAVVKHRDMIAFYWKLWAAQRQAEAYYATCPTVVKDIAYSAQTDQRLDVYQPKHGPNQPVLVYVYGGSWNGGRKTLYAAAAQRLLPAGVMVVIPDYTLYPAAGYPTQTQEIAAALAWTLEHAAEYGGDPRKVVVAAQSAGAHLAALALLDPQFLAAHGHSTAEVRGLCGISGVYDIETQLAHERSQGRSGQYVVEVMGGWQNIAAASPSTFVTADAPRTLLIHGDRDQTVPLRMSVEFHERLQAAGADSRFTLYPGSGHSGILFDALAQTPSRLLTEIAQFLRECTAEA
ncbi:MAG: alpha/beta hydrolase [Anaerolineales bacterium]|nr:alpha/beta hydrolase [Anaerolineales bacterium]